MTYYSTGFSKHLPTRGKVVLCENDVTIGILLKKGCIVETLEELKENVIVEKEIQTQRKVAFEVPKKKGNPNFGKKKVK